MKKKTKKVVINNCFGGFGLSDEAYEQLIKWGIPVRGYIKEPLNPNTGLYDIKIKENEGEVIFDRMLEDKNDLNTAMMKLSGRYWDTWLDENREHPLLVKVVEKLGKKASERFAKLKIVKIPANVEYEIKDYDGLETIHEKHRSWS